MDCPAYAKAATMAATPRTPAALATYFIEAAPVGAADEAAEAAALVALVALERKALADLAMFSRTKEKAKQ